MTWTPVSIISLGTNLQPVFNLRKAIRALERFGACRYSRVWLTVPDGPSQPLFYNSMAALEAAVTQEVLRDIELDQGRVRKGSRSGPRQIDLDLQMAGRMSPQNNTHTFLADEVFRWEWYEKPYAHLPLQDLFNAVVLLRGVPERVLLGCDEEVRRSVYGVTPLEALSESHGDLAPQAGLMNRLFAFVETTWRGPDYKIGAMIVSGGEPVTAALTAPRSTQDPLAHAEVQAIRAASREHGSRRLLDCWLYVTHEPCAMCVNAASQADLRGIVWAIDHEDAPSLFLPGYQGAIAALSPKTRMALYRGVQRHHALRLFPPDEVSTVPGQPEEDARELSLSDFYDAVAEEYYDEDLHPNTYAVSRVHEELRQTLLVSTPGPLLDLGCGGVAEGGGGRFIGVDRSWMMLGLRRSTGAGTNSVLGDIVELPFRSTSFSGAFCGLVLDHVFALAEVAREIRRVLTRDAEVIVTMFDPRFLPAARYVAGAMYYRSRIGRILRVATVPHAEADLITAFEKAGLSARSRESKEIRHEAYILNIYRFVAQ